jgi:hypothetical protein
LFAGSGFNSIDLLLTPIFYTKKKNDIQLHGYRSTFKNYDRDSVKSLINSFIDNKGVKLKFNVRKIYKIIY